MHEPVEAPNAVDLVNHVVASLKLQRIDLLTPAWSKLALRGAEVILRYSKKLLLGNHSQRLLRQNKTVRERGDCDGNLPRCNRRHHLAKGNWNLSLGEDFNEPVGRAVAFSRNHNTLAATYLIQHPIDGSVLSKSRDLPKAKILA